MLNNRTIMFETKLAKIIFIIVVLVLGISLSTYYIWNKKHAVIKVEKPDSPIESCAVGRKLFKSNCSACHNINNYLVAPPLAFAAANRKREWFISFTRDYRVLVSTGDSAAINVTNSTPNSMTLFPTITDSQIDSIISYIKLCGANEK